MNCRPCIIFQKRGFYMDLRYLLLLQQFRESAGDLMTALMMLVTNFATIGSAVLCVIIFWTVDRILGYWVIINTVSGLFINNVIKLTACVYRPWIRWQELDPPEKAIETATGYSFPSGHTQIASSFFGSCAMSARKDHKAVSAFCIAVILLTAFSRNFLGVHTLTDVLTSILISAVMIAVNARLFERVRTDRSLLIKLLAAGCAAAVLAIIYFTIKTYPMDYLDGDLIVDPAEMKNDGYAAAGAFLGTLAGAYIEIRHVRFTTEGTLPVRILRVICGLPFVLVLMFVLKKPIYSIAGTAAGHVIIYTVLTLYIIAGYPAVFTAVRRRRNNGQDAEKDYSHKVSDDPE